MQNTVQLVWNATGKAYRFSGLRTCLGLGLNKVTSCFFGDTSFTVLSNGPKRPRFLLLSTYLTRNTEHQISCDEQLYQTQFACRKRRNQFPHSAANHKL